MRTIALALIGFIAANFTDRFLLLFISFYEYHPNVLIFSGILQVLGNILLAVLISQYLLKSIVVLRTQGRNKKNIASTSFGVLLFIVMFGGQLMAVIVFQNANNYIVTSKAESVERIKVNLNSKLAPSKLAKLSFLYAQQEYEFNGAIIEYKTEDGNRHKYEPTEDSRKNRYFVMMSGLYYRLEPRIRAIAAAIWGLMALGIFLYIFYKPDKGNAISN